MHAEIKIIRPEDMADFYALLQVFEEVFAMDSFIRPPESKMQQLLQRDTFYAIAASLDGRIVAGLTLYGRGGSALLLRARLITFRKGFTLKE
jgi:hypothetical protein